MMNLTFFNTDADIGAAGREAYTLLTHIRDDDIRTKMYVRDSGVEDDDVHVLRTGFLRSRVQRFIDWWLSRCGCQDKFRLSTLGLLLDQWVRGTDIFQIYNLHSGYFSLGLLPYIAGSRPIVWRICDLWPLSGRTGYTEDFDRWLRESNGIPTFETCYSLTADRSSRWLEKRRRTFYRCNMTVVTPTEWMRRLVKRSPLFGHSDVMTIPTGIDMRVYHSVDRGEARERLGIPEGSVVLLCDSGNLLDPSDSGRQFERVLEQVLVKGPREFLILIAGTEKPELSQELMQRCRFISNSDEEHDMRDIYSAADVFVSTARTDVTLRMLIESLACGTPCITSNFLGTEETIEHGVNGLLVDAGDYEELVHSILRVLYDDNLLRYMHVRCRNSVLDKHDIREQVSTYRRLYEHLLDRPIPSQPIRNVIDRRIFSSRQLTAYTT